MYVFLLWISGTWLRNTVLSVSTETPPTSCLNVLFERVTNQKKVGLKGEQVKQFVTNRC